MPYVKYRSFNNEQNQKWLQRYARTSNKRRRNQIERLLGLRNIPMLRSMVYPLMYWYYTAEELQNEAYLQIVKCVKTFDTKKHIRFSTYICSSWLRRIHLLYCKACKYVVPTYILIEGCRGKKVRTKKHAEKLMDVIASDYLWKQRKEIPYSILRMTKDEQPDLNFDNKEYINIHLMNLKRKHPKYHEVISLRFGFTDKGAMTLREISKMLGVSYNTINVRYNRGLAYLKSVCEDISR